MSGTVSTISQFGAVALAVSLLAACHSATDKVKEITSVNGVWHKPGYGLWFQITDNELKVFNSNKAGCVRQQDYSGTKASQLRGMLKLHKAGQQLTLEQDQGLVGTLQRREQLPSACLQPMNNQRDSALNFEFFWQAMQENYAFLTERGVNWNALYQQYKPLFANATLQQQQGYYQQILSQLPDGHLSLQSDDGSMSAYSVAPRGLYAQLMQQSRPDGDGSALEEAIELLQQQTTAFLLAPGIQRSKATDAIQFGMLPGNIGYLRIDRLSELAADSVTELDLLTGITLIKNDVALAKQAMLEVKTALANSNGLIVDLRFNGGGADPVALEIASHFNQQTDRLIGSKQVRGEPVTEIRLAAATSPYNKPLRVLAGGATVSAAEVLALALKSLPQARLIGEATHGSVSDVLSHQLPNGWRLQMSNELYLDPQGKLQEVQGVLPHTLAFPYLSLDTVFNRSTILDVAVQQLGAPALAPERSQSQIQAVVDNFRQQFHIPGVTAAVLSRGKIVATFSSGYADLATQTPMTDRTPLQVASISKTVLGTAMVLKDIDPQAALPALPLVVDFPTAAQPTLRWGQLATHQSGIVDNEQALACSIYQLADGSSLVAQYTDAACDTPITDHGRFLREYLQRGGQYYAPTNFGTTGELVYSNMGTELTSLAFEQFTNQPFAQWSAEHIFAPLQLQQSFWPTVSNTASAATLYMADGSPAVIALPPYASSDYYAGTWHTSSRDLATYLAAVVSPNAELPLAGMTAARRDQLFGISAGYQPGQDFPRFFWHRSGDYVGHTGEFVGVSSIMYHNLATDTGVVLLMNAGFQLHPQADDKVVSQVEQQRLALFATLYRHGLSLSR